MKEDCYDEYEQKSLCSSIDWCDYHHILDDCGSEYCAKFDKRWNTWNGENFCDEMAELGYSPEDESDE